MSFTVLLRAAAPRARLVLGAALVGAGSDLASLTLTTTAVWLITRASQHPGVAALGLAIVGVRAFALLRGVLRYWERLLSHDAALRATVRLRTRIYQALVDLDPFAPTLPRDADLQARLVADVEVVQDLMLRCVIPALCGLVVGAAAVGFAWTLAPLVAAVLAIGLLTAGGGVPLLATAASARAERRAAAARTCMAVATLDLLDGAPELAAAADSTVLGRTTAAIDAIRRLERPGTPASATATALLLQGLTTIAVAALATVRVRAGALDGTMVPVLALTALASFETVKPLAAAGSLLSAARGPVGRLVNLLEAPRHATHPTALISCPARPTAWELRDVRIRYPAGTRPALDGVSLRLERGQSVALVGASGSGKSTLIAVLSRLVEPERGQLLIDGTDASHYDPDEVRLGITSLLQDAHVFAAGVRANLTVAAPESGPGRLREATGQAQLLDWVEGLPDGFETVIGDDGKTMSGGQRKRLLLARALLADRPLMLLDEPTEGLDAATADTVMTRIRAVCAERALCVATHRLVGLDSFDRILVLHEGRVVQQGSHAELLAAPGVYRELWQGEMQSAAWV
ncbi:thiol reductant ABC exporter subunit CydC [Kitasatospora sp. RB6PN24]|uniref:thiol reductant ABC exporter subunit CydC n=1 Tax=Kitasatospora humi TaxID=2893891 RepID=UPI001E518D92|nr:thiol reductant ABC exporter subunit CydC [Kitasatospora humi]MCC9310101.1 thiol reductant ABC exporter subunit CydC [Kitasatospora humi]